MDSSSRDLGSWHRNRGARMNIQHSNERYFEEKDIWVMDSECCCECGALLADDETNICWFCWQNERPTDEEQDTYDGWGSDWDIPITATTLPAFFAAVSLFALAAVLESLGER